MGTKNIVQLLTNSSVDSGPIIVGDGGQWMFQSSSSGGTGTTGSLQIRAADGVTWVNVAGTIVQANGSANAVVELPSGIEIRVTVGTATGVSARLLFIRD
jgi:hypothetical protein